MCGLFGFCGNIPVEKRQVLSTALCVMNTSRGDESVGVAAVNRRWKSPAIWKDTGTPVDAVRQRGFRNVVNLNAPVLIGHTRWSTHGTVSKKNAHPFHIGDCVGAHNGVISNVSAFREKTGKNYAVDSQFLIHMLATDNYVGYVEGPANLTYVKLKDSPDLSLVRWGNPLGVAMLSDNQGLIWSSEETHLESALAIAGIDNYELLIFDDEYQWNVYLASDGSISDLACTEPPMYGSTSGYIGYTSYNSKRTYSRWDEEKWEDGETIKTFGSYPSKSSRDAAAKKSSTTTNGGSDAWLASGTRTDADMLPKHYQKIGKTIDPGDKVKALPCYPDLTESDKHLNLLPAELRDGLDSEEMERLGITEEDILMHYLEDIDPDDEFGEYGEILQMTDEEIASADAEAAIMREMEEEDRERARDWFEMLRRGGIESVDPPRAFDPDEELADIMDAEYDAEEAAALRSEALQAYGLSGVDEDDLPSYIPEEYLLS